MLNEDENGREFDDQALICHGTTPASILANLIAYFQNKPEDSVGDEIYFVVLSWKRQDRFNQKHLRPAHSEFQYSRSRKRHTYLVRASSAEHATESGINLGAS